MSEQAISVESTSGTRPVRPWKVIVAASVGNALEWYDIAIYAYFSVYISVAFFPSESHSVSIMLALGTFALSFFIRPVGAIVLGSYADRKGRKPALTLTIWLMFLGTLMIVIMPPAHAIGLAPRCTSFLPMADRRHGKCQGTCLLGAAGRCAQCGCDPRGVAEARCALLPRMT